jgi:DNA polymerase III epsilon subunit-like protein
MTTETATKPAPPLAFVDCETLGLDPEKHAMWELTVIRRANGVTTEHLWQIKPYRSELENAEPEALDINGYRDRMVLPDDYQVGDMTHACGLPHPMKRDELRDVLRELLDGAVMVGSNPAFDAGFLRVFLDGDTPWHYRTVDIATLAAGYLRGYDLSAGEQQPLRVPFSSRQLSRAVGVEPPGNDAHQALVDARWAMNVYDAVMGGQQ